MLTIKEVYMSSQDIITYCAPTLVGIKTANIFNERYETEDELKKSISHFNHSFKDYGLRMTSLGEKNNRALIYVYREQALIRDFKNQLSQELLKQYGYDSKPAVQPASSEDLPQAFFFARRCAVESISLMRLSWLTSLVPGS